MLLAYVLSYVNVGIFWNNHHHMLHITERVDGRVLWANLGLLFWLTLVPFVIRWIDESGFTAAPVAAYGVVLSCAAIGYSILATHDHRGERRTLTRGSRPRSARTRRASCRSCSICWESSMAFVQPWVSIALYIAVALMWLVPDRRIEQLLKR